MCLNSSYEPQKYKTCMELHLQMFSAGNQVLQGGLQGAFALALHLDELRGQTFGFGVRNKLVLLHLLAR